MVTMPRPDKKLFLQILRDIRLRGRACTALLLLLTVFVSLSVFSVFPVGVAYAADGPEEKYLDEDAERWKGGPALFETKEGLERTPVPPMEGWREKKVVPLPVITTVSKPSCKSFSLSWARSGRNLNAGSSKSLW